MTCTQRVPFHQHFGCEHLGNGRGRPALAFRERPCVVSSTGETTVPVSVFIASYHLRRIGNVHGIGRNDPCPCGSGKKYKKCCQSRDQASAAERLSQPLRTMSIAPQTPSSPSSVKAAWTRPSRQPSPSRATTPR
ncbi:MAG TPA: SEC-C metal-binding domain-containing protein [Anaeromyxobacteraceae bacterium]|nr:SEC-C metal-binding domain-containing protein [Anaeromyxobacteraceae bacterium]